MFKSLSHVWSKQNEITRKIINVHIFANTNQLDISNVQILMCIMYFSNINTPTTKKKTFNKKNKVFI